MLGTVQVMQLEQWSEQTRFPSQGAHTLTRAMGSKPSLRLWEGQCRTWRASTMNLTKNQGEGEVKTWSLLGVTKTEVGESQRNQFTNLQWESWAHLCWHKRPHLSRWLLPSFQCGTSCLGRKFPEYARPFLPMFHFSFLEISFSSLN